MKKPHYKDYSKTELSTISSAERHNMELGQPVLNDGKLCTVTGVNRITSEVTCKEVELKDGCYVQKETNE